MFLACALLLMQACKKEEAVKPNTGIAITVQDDKGTLADGATIYLFNNFTEYNSFTTGKSTAYAQKGTADANGKVTFNGLVSDSSIDYHFFAEKGSLNNTGPTSKFKMGGTLTKDNMHYVTVVLNGTLRKQILFYSNDSQIVGNEISIYRTVNGALPQNGLHTLTTIGDENGTVTDNGIFIYAPDNGLQTFYIKNEYGCVWTKKIEVTSTTDIKVVLESCNDQAITFTSSDIVSGDVKVFLNNETTAAGIITPSSKSFTIYRPTGKYAYKATHSNGICTWIGETSSKTIDLKDCK